MMEDRLFLNQLMW